MPKKNPADHQPYQPVDAAFLRGLPTVLNTPPPGPDEVLGPPPEGPPAAQPLPQLALVPKPEPVAAARDDSVAGLQPVDLTVEPLNQPIKFRVSRSEAFELRRIVTELGEQLQTTVDVANLCRAFLLLLRHAEHEVKLQARRNGPLKRPRNDNPAALAEFDHRLAQLLASGVRKAMPLP
jgi:hypothetical protein